MHVRRLLAIGAVGVALGLVALAVSPLLGSGVGALLRGYAVLELAATAWLLLGTAIAMALRRPARQVSLAPVGARRRP
ncbi:MAG TPA: hypothetical protein VHK06_02015 [Candidatus Limnocylindria bacterium]|nr:hypothetical protein [Candidatus Limnocylindria bacterium]